MTGILLARGYEEVEAITPLDFLRRAGIEVISIGLGSRKITGSHNIEIIADIEISNFNEKLDCIIIPGGPGAQNISDNDAACRLILDTAKNGGLIAAICAAPAVVLYPLGLLDKKRATCFPGFEQKMPNALITDERVVTDGNIITSKGAGTAAVFSFLIIEKLTDKETSDKIFNATIQK